MLGWLPVTTWSYYYITVDEVNTLMSHAHQSDISPRQHVCWLFDRHASLKPVGFDKAICQFHKLQQSDICNDFSPRALWDSSAPCMLSYLTSPCAHLSHILYIIIIIIIYNKILGQPLFSTSTKTWNLLISSGNSSSVSFSVPVYHVWLTGTNRTQEAGLVQRLSLTDHKLLWLSRQLVVGAFVVCCDTKQ